MHFYAYAYFDDLAIYIIWLLLLEDIISCIPDAMSQCRNVTKMSSIANEVKFQRKLIKIDFIVFLADLRKLFVSNSYDKMVMLF